MTIVSKPRLLPLLVPWQVDLDTPFLQLTARENGNAEVTFIGDFGPHMAQQEIGASHGHSPSAEVTIVDRPEALFAGPGFERFRFQMVEIEFSDIGAARMLPPESDHDVIDETRYDWSAVQFIELLAHNTDLWRSNFLGAWSQGHCPNPYFYEVQDSAWLSSFRYRTSQHRHFLISGHDAYVEILCQSWTWKSHGAIADWD